MPRRLWLYLMGLCVVTLWGASFPLSKAALEHVGPIAFSFLRWSISAIVLVFWLAWRSRRSGTLFPPQTVTLLRNEWRSLAWLSFVGISLYYLLQNFALRFTTATNAGVLANLTSVFMVLIATWLLHERLAGLEWFATAAAFGGSILVSQGSGHLSWGGPGLFGDMLMVLAGLAAAIYSIGGKRLSATYSPVLVTTIVGVLGAIFLLPLALVEGFSLALPVSVWGILLLLGAGSGALANVWWLTLLAHVPASRAALALFFIPVVAAVLSVVLLNEPITPTLVLGALLILAGVFGIEVGHARPGVAAHTLGADRRSRRT